MTLQDCAVAGWSDPNGAVQISGAPVTVFDCTFSDGPLDQRPVRVNRKEQRVIFSENLPSTLAELVQAPAGARLYEIPAGKRHRTITSATERFFRTEARVPDHVFDAKLDFGAKGDGNTDDTRAIKAAINAARKHGTGAIAYLPTGRYVITETLQVSGKDYTVGGTGFRTSLVWKGEKGGTMVAVHDVGNVTLEHIAIGNHDAGQMDNGIDILHTVSDGPSRMTYDGVFVYGMYQKQPDRKGLRLRGLDSDDVVVMPHLQGNIHVEDCQDATILANCSYEGSITVSGRSKASGFLGFMTRLATLVTHGLYLRDNQNIVMSDFYIEQAENGLVFEGATGVPPGRAVIQGAKLHFSPGKDGRETGTAMDIRNCIGRPAPTRENGSPAQPWRRVRHGRSGGRGISGLGADYVSPNRERAEAIPLRETVNHRCRTRRDPVTP